MLGALTSSSGRILFPVFFRYTSSRVAVEKLTPERLMPRLSRALTMSAISLLAFFAKTVRQSPDSLMSDTPVKLFRRLIAVVLSLVQFFRLIWMESAPNCCLSSVGEPLATIFPTSMIASDLQSLSASSMYWVVRNIVVFSSLFSFSRYSHMAERDCGSSPVVGSSRKSSWGLWTRVVARSNLFFIPPE